MKSELEKKLWKAGQEKEPYPQEIWYQIIDALLEDFQKFIGQNFQREQEIYLDINSPVFGHWMWAKEVKKPFFATTWAAVIGGGMVGNEKGNDIFSISLTLFLFDVTSKKRLCLNTGESVLEFIFEKKSDGYGYWRSLGWHKDANYEWENVEWEDLKWK